MRFKTIFALGLVTVVFWGCASMPEPTPGKDTLVTCQPNFVGADMPWQTLNGSHTSGITVTLTNRDSKQVYTKAVDPSGIANFVGLPEGHYWLSRLAIKLVDSRMNFTFVTNWGTHLHSFEVVAGKVNNLGQIVWKLAYTGNSYGKSGGGTNISTSASMIPGGGYEDSQAYFKKSYPKTAWNDSEWVNTAFK